MREELELNRDRWDEATRFHARDNVYGIQDFKAGMCRLHRVELEEVGDVRDRTLLHLQCHFGLDTLSWARRGAIVTGADFSPEAIALARTLGTETNLPGTFVLFPITEDLEKAGGFRPFLDYFHDPAGIRWPPSADYADPNAQHTLACHEWHHSLSDILNALIGAGLVIEFLHEFPFCAWEVVAGTEIVERFSSSHAYYGLPASRTRIPLMFTLRARKPAR